MIRSRRRLPIGYQLLAVNDEGRFAQFSNTVCALARDGRDLCDDCDLASARSRRDCHRHSGGHASYRRKLGRFWGTSGLSSYGFNFLTDKALEPDRISPSNLIRQASSSAALANYYDYTKDPVFAIASSARLAAFGSFRFRSVKRGCSKSSKRRASSRYPGPMATQGCAGRFGLLYRPSGAAGRQPDGKYDNALAGTVALALLTELIYSRASGMKASRRCARPGGILSLRIRREVSPKSFASTTLTTTTARHGSRSPFMARCTRTICNRRAFYRTWTMR
jgi:hypothetical protein